MAKKKKKTWKRHFYGAVENEIHTSRTPKCERGDACEYQKAARKGSLARFEKLQDHHLIPVSAIIRYQDPKESYGGYIEAIDAAYKAQDYCVNNKQNLEWLPTKPTFLGHSKTSEVWDLNLPCHTIGHAAYFQEVLQELRRHIWNPLKEAQDDEECPESAVDVAVAFTNLERDFRNRVRSRGLRPGLMGGTRYAIEHQGVGTTWWHAFSMADAPACTDAVRTFITQEIPAALRR